MLGPSVAGSSPSIRRVPAVAGDTQPIIRIVLLLPAPFGPRKPKASPRSTSRSMASTAVKLPKRFVSPRAWIRGKSAMKPPTLQARSPGSAGVPPLGSLHRASLATRPGARRPHAVLQVQGPHARTPRGAARPPGDDAGAVGPLHQRPPARPSVPGWLGHGDLRPWVLLGSRAQVLADARRLLDRSGLRRAARRRTPRTKRCAAVAPATPRPCSWCSIRRWSATSSS